MDASTQASIDWQTLGQTWANSRQCNWWAAGGNLDLLASVGPQPAYGDSDGGTGGAFTNWVQSIATAPAIIAFHLTDLSTLFSGALQTAVWEALQAYTNSVYALADFTTTGQPGALNITNQTGLIQVGSAMVTNPMPIPLGFNPQFVQGGAQLAVLDGTTLQPLVNVGLYYDASQEQSPAFIWSDFLGAVHGLTHQYYIVVLTAYGMAGSSGYPTPLFANWLASCGASLTNWNNLAGNPYGDDYYVSYVLIGQQGLHSGSALEKFNSNFVAGAPGAVGDFSASVTAPLVPPASGPYQIAPQVARPRPRAALAAGQTPAAAAVMCQWNGAGPWQGSWWNVGDLTCFDGTARLCQANGTWSNEGPC